MRGAEKKEQAKGEDKGRLMKKRKWGGYSKGEEDKSLLQLHHRTQGDLRLVAFLTSEGKEGEKGKKR